MLTLAGRAYLSQIPILLKLLMDTLRTEEKDSLTRESVLVALQKLSLRYMIAILRFSKQGLYHCFAPTGHDKVLVCC